MSSPKAALLASFSLLLALPSISQSGGDEFATTFCPECWTFLEPKESAGQEDSCLRCGKVGIAVDACEVTWTWCLDHQAWHRRPCPQAGSYRNVHVRTGLAIVVSPGDERLQQSAYCPECRIIPDPMKMERGLCPSCKGPLAVADTVEVGWFWCTQGLYWKDLPCPENGVRHCCSPRRGTLLAKMRGDAGAAGTAAARASSGTAHP